MACALRRLNTRVLHNIWEAAVEATVVAMGVAVRRPEAVYIRIKSIVKASISLSSTRKGYGSGVWIKGMDQSMDRGVWIVCSFGALIHTLYFDSYPYSFLVGSGSDVCVNSPSLPGVGGRGRSPLIYIYYNTVMWVYVLQKVTGHLRLSGQNNV